MLMKSLLPLPLGRLASVFLVVVFSGAMWAWAGEPGGLPARPVVEMAAPASPASQPMVIARMRAEDRCDTLCPEWIMAQGLITPDTPGRFRQMLVELGSQKRPVVLDSKGGDLDAALEIGRMIRARGLTTIIGTTVVKGCSPRDETCNTGRPAGLAYQGYVTSPGMCEGACLFVQAGGTRRAGYWITGAQLDAPDSFKTRAAGGDAESLIGAYLAEMGISPGLLARLRRSSLPLDRTDMLHFGLSTGHERVEDFTGTSVCTGAKPAANCVARGAAPQPKMASATAAPQAMLRPTNAVVKQVPPRPRRVIVWGGMGAM